MALRFRKSIKLAPGVRWNISGSGSSWTFGPRGASINVGSRGTLLNAGIGAGLSSRNRLSAPRPSARRNIAALPPPAPDKVSLTCAIHDDGTLVFTDAAAQPASDAHIALAKAQAKDALKDLITGACDKLNGQIEALACLHHETHDPTIKPVVHALHFGEPAPAGPVAPSLKWWERFVPGRYARIAAELPAPWSSTKRIRRNGQKRGGSTTAQ